MMLLATENTEKTRTKAADAFHLKLVIPRLVRGTHKRGTAQANPQTRRSWVARISRAMTIKYGCR